MKELYFSPETIDDRSVEMRLAAHAMARHGRFSLKPPRVVLLVLDMQAYFLDPSSHAFLPSAVTILPRLSGLVSDFYSHNLPVIFTRHVNTPEDAGLMAVWWRDLIREDNPLSQISHEFDLSDGRVLEKSQYDAFYQTDLAVVLHSQGIQQVVIGGVMTHLCCETTARAAFAHGFEVFFLVDGTATYTAAYHQASLLNLAHGFSELTLVQEVSDSLRGVKSHA